MPKNNRHVWNDQVYLWKLKARHKPFFAGGLDTPALEEHLRVLDFKLPDLPRGGRAEVVASSLVGPLKAAVHVLAVASPQDPIIIFHHEYAENPAEAFVRLRQAAQPHAITLLGVEAPFHSHRKEPMTGTGALMAYLAMLSLPIALTQRLLEQRFATRARARGVAGFGQGGFIANLHHLLHNSADYYFPFMSGTAQAEMFLGALPVAKPIVRKPEKLRALLNFDGDWSMSSHTNVFPVLGSADLINRFDTQARSYADTPIEVWNAGHVDTSREPVRMVEKILRHLHGAAGAGAGESTAA